MRSIRRLRACSSPSSCQRRSSSCSSMDGSTGRRTSVADTSGLLGLGGTRLLIHPWPDGQQRQGGQTWSLVRGRPLRYNNPVDKGGQTVSATEFAELTGVSRERLRTWERRFDFPRPARVGHGPRRYALADAPRVVAVRRAAEQGVPLPRAIADAQGAGGDDPAGGVSDDTLATAAAVAPI